MIISGFCLDDLLLLFLIFDQLSFSFKIEFTLLIDNDCDLISLPVIITLTATLFNLFFVKLSVILELEIIFIWYFSKMEDEVPPLVTFHLFPQRAEFLLREFMRTQLHRMCLNHKQSTLHWWNAVWLIIWGSISLLLLLYWTIVFLLIPVLELLKSAFDW